MKQITIKVTGDQGAGKSLILDRVIGPALRTVDVVFAFNEARHEITFYLSDDNVRLITGEIDDTPKPR